MKTVHLSAHEYEYPSSSILLTQTTLLDPPVGGVDRIVHDLIITSEQFETIYDLIANQGTL